MGTFTENLLLAQPTPLDPAVKNVWGSILNTNDALLDDAVAGYLPLDVSGNSNVILTSTAGASDQSRQAIFDFTGTLTGNINVLWPQGLSGRYVIRNGTSGAFSLSLGVNNGSGSPVGATVGVLQGTVVSVATDGTDFLLATSNGAVPTQQVLTSGSAATYTTGTQNGVRARQLRIREVGGAGGGQGVSASALGGVGGTGGDTSFGGNVAKGGEGGKTAGASVGGNGGAGVASVNIDGAGGCGGSLYANPNPVQTQQSGYMGASSPFGGAGGGSIGTGGQDASANSGSGAGGASYADTGGGGQYMALGGSGAAGQYKEFIINAPDATYLFTVGPGGTRGSGTLPGGLGGAGIIIVDEIY